jgi:hypothetical protein
VQGEIISLRFTLEKYCKNKYFGDGYSIYGSFRAQTSQISCLTGKASQSALETATSPSQGYDGVAHFRHGAHQSCKKSARTKFFVNNTFGDKTLLIIQTNCIQGPAAKH